MTYGGTKVKITWKAFGNKPEIGRFISSVEFKIANYHDEIDADTLLNALYAETNTYQGNTWDLIQPLLSPTRTHTALSIGDEIEINGQAYIVADFGFEKVEDVEIEYLPAEYGDKSVFKVTKKVGV